MSPKVTQKVSELLTVLIALLLFCIALVGYGLATRPKTIRITYYTYEVRMMKSSSSHAILNTIDFLQWYVEFNQQIEMVKEPESPLEGPALYDSYIDQITADIYPDLDPDLIRAIVYTESRYNPSSVNPKTNATGLTQILPKWHTQRALSLGVSDLSDPYGNLLVCCDLLHELYQKYPKNYALDVFAGGYPYANSYAGSLSPHTIKINQTIQGLRNGSIIPGGG